jgi:YVTN family beta-propeller protein
MSSSNASVSSAAACVAGLLAVIIGVPPAHAASLAYVSNSSGASVSVVDTATNTVVATIATGPRPIGLAITPDRTRLYVANSDSDSISVVATSTNTVIGTIGVGAFPQGLALSPDGSHLYVTNSFSDFVSVITTASDAVTATIPVGIGPEGVAVSPDGSQVLVTVPDALLVIDAVSNAVVATIPVGSNPFGVAITPDGQHAYVASNGSDSVSVVDLGTDSVVATIGMVQPVAIAIAPGGARAYVTNSSETFGAISIVDTASNTVIGTVDIGPNAQGVAITPDGRRAYAASLGSDTVSVIDTMTNAVTTTVPVGSGPVWVAITPGVGPPTDKNQCRNRGWREFTFPRTFKNQGDCVSFVNRDSHSSQH